MSKYNEHTAPLFKKLNRLTINDMSALQELKFLIPDSSDMIGQEFLEYLGDTNMIQKVDVYTRLREGQNPLLLDLVLVNEDYMVDNVASEPPFWLTNHVVVAFVCMCYCAPEDVERSCANM